MWSVDPIDGTKTMVSYANGKKDHTGFAVNIGLLKNHKPIQGVVYYPAKDGGTLYYTGDDGKAYKQVGQTNPQVIMASPISGEIKAAVPWDTHQRPETIRGQHYQAIPEVGGGRLLRVAEGDAHLSYTDDNFAYWDLSAAHAILKAAGGDILNAATGKELIYNNVNPSLPATIGGHLDSLIRIFQ
jgi:3'-phosphoadenosine 5'-phosphosulfate (PAPS) 3'-phosphatase